MRITEFWRRMEQRFGSGYAHSLAADYRLPALGCTVAEALRAGTDPKTIWQAVGEEFDLPNSLR